MSLSLTREDLILQAANELLIPNNTVTTLEIKTKLRREQPHLYLKQDFVSAVMNQYYQQGLFLIVDDNGTFRTYASPTWQPQVAVDVTISVVALPASEFTKTLADVPVLGSSTSNTTPDVPATRVDIDKSKALDFIKNNRGHFFTVLYTDADGSQRTYSCQYSKDQTGAQPNTIKVKESIKLRLTPTDPFLFLNLDNVKELNIDKKIFAVK